MLPGWLTRPALAAAAATLAVMGGLVWAGAQIAERDRAAIRDELASARLVSLQGAAAALASDVGKIGEDLELAALLMSQTADLDDRTRELHAIAAITREYAAVDLRDRDGRSLTRVVAPDAPPGLLDHAAAVIDETVAQAAAMPGVFRTSGPLRNDESDLAWYRVFARRSLTDTPLVVAVVVDMRPLLERARLLQTSTTRLLVMGARGRPAPSSDPRLAAVVRDLDAKPLPGVAAVVAAIRARTTAVVELAGREAAAIGLPSSPAVAVTTPVLIEDGEPWALALITSTAELRAQEWRVVRRLLVLGTIALAAVVALAIYMVSNARRAAILRERVRQADRMAHLTDKADKILDHIPSGVVALTATGVVAATNRWLRDRLGFDPIGRELATLFAGPQVTGAALAQLYREARATGAVRSRHSLEVCLGGHLCRASVHAVPLAHPLEDVDGVLVIEDHEPLRQIEARVLHSEKLVTAGQLAAGIAHEIGTPLNVIRARAELVTRRLGDATPHGRDLAIIVDQIDHVTRLLHQLLDYVRSTPQEIAQVKVEDAMHAVASLVEVEAAKRSIAIAVDCPATVGTIAADPGQLRQVLVNLTVNALDACAAGARVTLRAYPAEDRVILEVEDDGPGIPLEVRAQVFDPFFTTKKRGRGTGLGLWVVAQLARSHDASIEIAEGHSRGTLVRLRWPRDRSQP